MIRNDLQVQMTRPWELSGIRGFVAGASKVPRNFYKHARRN
jgi:hypothetical protein